MPSEQNELDIENELYRIALALIEKRYPKGWGGAAVVRTADERYFSSVALETIDSNVELCIEVGAMCEASKYNEKITHCLCVVRDVQLGKYKVLTPCGICQERLRYWGIDVKVGVTTHDNSTKFITLSELQPYHWTTAFSDIEYYDDRNVN